LERARVNVKTSKTGRSRSLYTEVPVASPSLSVSACNRVSSDVNADIYTDVNADIYTDVYTNAYAYNYAYGWLCVINIDSG
jgi:hypothetical protein